MLILSSMGRNEIILKKIVNVVISIMLCCMIFLGASQSCSAIDVMPPALEETGENCYMNAMIQQLYNIKSVRQAIVNFNPSKLSEKEKKDIIAINDAVWMRKIFKLFLLFAGDDTILDVNVYYLKTSFYKLRASDPKCIFLNQISKILKLLKLPEFKENMRLSSYDSWNGGLVLANVNRADELKDELTLKNGKKMYLTGVIAKDEKIDLKICHMYSYVRKLKNEKTDCWFLLDRVTNKNLGAKRPNFKDGYLAFYCEGTYCN